MLQLAHSYDSSEMYGDNYGYRSGLNQSMVDHLHQKVLRIQEIVDLENDIVTQVTGLTTEEWSAIMSTINTVSANRALGQYYDYQ